MFPADQESGAGDEGLRLRDKTNAQNCIGVSDRRAHIGRQDRLRGGPVVSRGLLDTGSIARAFAKSDKRSPCTPDAH